MNHPLTYSVTDAAKALSIGRTSLYALIGDGSLKARKIGGRTIFLHEDIVKFLADETEEYKPKGEK